MQRLPFAVEAFVNTGVLIVAGVFTVRTLLALSNWHKNTSGAGVQLALSSRKDKTPHAGNHNNNAQIRIKRRILFNSLFLYGLMWLKNATFIMRVARAQAFHNNLLLQVTECFCRLTFQS